MRKQEAIKTPPMSNFGLNSQKAGVAIYEPRKKIQSSVRDADTPFTHSSTEARWAVDHVNMESENRFHLQLYCSVW